MRLSKSPNLARLTEFASHQPGYSPKVLDETTGPGKHDKADLPANDVFRATVDRGARSGQDHPSRSCTLYSRMLTCTPSLLWLYPAKRMSVSSRLCVKSSIYTGWYSGFRGNVGASDPQRLHTLCSRATGYAVSRSIRKSGPDRRCNCGAGKDVCLSDTKWDHLHMGKTLSGKTDVSL